MKTREDKDLIYITFFGGILGLHRFLKKEYGLGILYLLTGGVLGLGYLMDLILEVKNHQI